MVALLLAVVAGAGSASATPDGRHPSLPRAEIIRPAGVDPSLFGGAPGERVRVTLLLRRQPALAEASKPSFQAGLTGYADGGAQGLARRSPGEVTARESAFARRAERRRGKLIRSLRDELATVEEIEAPVEAEVTRLGGSISDDRIELVAAVPARLPREALEKLGRRRSVQAIHPSPRRRPALDTSTRTVNAFSVWPSHNGGGREGSGGGADDVVGGLEVGMSGDSPDPDHLAFDGLVIDNGTTPAADHGTATGGVIASQDGTYRGVASGIAGLRGGNAAQRTSATDPVEGMSQSFGSQATSDDQGGFEDLEANALLIPWAASAGNYNNATGPAGSPTVSEPSIGRNLLSVGAFGDNSTDDPSDDLMWGESSFGPSPGGRKKPDLVAPGVAITTPNVNGGFDPETGTSLSTPHVAGAAAILLGAGMTDPRAIRAVLINSADDWCNGHWDHPPSGTSLTTAYPSGTCQDRWLPDVGWGELDVADAIAERGNAVVGDIAGGSARFYSASTAPGDKATLAWNLRGVLGEFVDDHVYFTVTDLNLRQYRPDGTEIAPPADPGFGAGPDAVDPNDTVEQVRAPSPGGEVVYKVEAASSVEGAEIERFGLASAGALSPLETPAVDPVQISRSPAGTVGCSQDVEIRAAAHNPSSDIEATASTLTIELPAGVSLVSGPATQEVSGGTLETDATAESHTWTVRPGSDGNHVLRIRGSGEAYGSTFRSDRSIGLAADCPEPAPSPAPGAGDTKEEVAVEPPAPVQCGVPDAPPDCEISNTRIAKRSVRERDGKIKARGRVAVAGLTDAPLRGAKVAVVAKRLQRRTHDSRTPRRAGKRRKRKVVELRRGGRFKAKLRACRRGRYRVSARFRGAPGNAPTAKKRLGKVRSGGC